MAILRSLKDGAQIEITAVEETPSCESDVTSHPVEDGSSVSDHVSLRPAELVIHGVVVENAAGALAQIQRWRDERHLMSFAGRHAVSNYVISEVRAEHDASIYDGFKITLALKEVRIVKPAIVQLVKPDPVTPTAKAQATTTQAKPVTNKGTQQIVDNWQVIDTAKKTAAKAEAKRKEPEPPLITKIWNGVKKDFAIVKSFFFGTPQPK